MTPAATQEFNHKVAIVQIHEINSLWAESAACNPCTMVQNRVRFLPGKVEGSIEARIVLKGVFKSGLCKLCMSYVLQPAGFNTVKVAQPIRDYSICPLVVLQWEAVSTQKL